MKRYGTALSALLLLAPACLLAQGGGKVVEEIVARVNNEIITLSDLQKSESTLQQEVAQDCPGCPPAKIDALYKERQKNLLRDMIDQSLLVQRGKDMGISVETDVVKRLDEVRQSNKLESLDDLEKAVEAQGLSWEEYKTTIRNGLLTNEVIHREVGSRINVGGDEVKKYYEEHKSEFVRPEQVLLAEIFFSTEGKTPEQIAEIRKKTEDLLARIKKGENFQEMARHYSEGQTSKQGGELGAFEKGQLSPQIEGVVFKLNKGEITDVIQTKTGLEILKVFEHYESGQQPLAKVENEITNRLYMERMQPTLRNYLAELREQSYVVVKPGYADSAAMGGNATIEEVAPTPDASTGKKPKKGKHSGQ
jgi:peptidyl-prolyl cis-trans isomerase SurA